MTFNRHKLPFLVEGLFLLMLFYSLYAVYDKRAGIRLYEPDEAAWIFSTYYAHLYFGQGNLVHDDWTDYDSYDHPPLAKFYYGLAVNLGGHSYDSIEAKRFWHSIPMNRFGRYYGPMMQRLPAGLLDWTRAFAFAAAICALAFLYLFARQRFGVTAALTVSGLLILNPVFREVSLQTLADPVLLAITAAFIWCISCYDTSGRRWTLIVSAGLAAFAILTKLNGLFLLGIWGGAIGLQWWQTRKQSDWLGIGISAVLYLVLVVLLNPLFLNAGPGALLDMVAHRQTHIALQQQIFQAAALIDPLQRLAASLDTLFFEQSVLFSRLHIPVEFMGFITGLVIAVKERRWLLLILALVLVALPIVLVPLAWSRYFYGIYPVVYLFVGLSLCRLGPLASQSFSRVFKRPAKRV